MAKEKKPDIRSLDFGKFRKHKHLSLAMAVALFLKFRVKGIDYIQMMYVGHNNMVSGLADICLEVNSYYILITVFKQGQSQTLVVFPKRKTTSVQKLSEVVERELKKNVKGTKKVIRMAYGTCANIGLATNLSEAFVAPVPLKMAEIRLYKQLIKAGDQGPTLIIKNPRKTVTEGRAGAWTRTGWRALLDKGVVELQKDDYYLVHRIEWCLIRPPKKKEKTETQPKAKSDSDKVSAPERREEKMKPDKTDSPKKNMPNIPPPLDPVLIPEKVALTVAQSDLYALLLGMAPPDKADSHFFIRHHGEQLNAMPGKKKNWYGTTLRSLKDLKLVSGTRGGIHVYRVNYTTVKRKPVKKAKPGNGKLASRTSMRNLAEQVAAQINDVSDMAKFLGALSKELRKKEKLSVPLQKEQALDTKKPTAN